MVTFSLSFLYYENIIIRNIVNLGSNENRSWWLYDSFFYLILVLFVLNHVIARVCTYLIIR